MAADTNLIKSADLKKVAAVDFVNQFERSINDLLEILGDVQRVEKIPGQQVKIYKASGTLKTDAVAEGDTIPLSKYGTEVTDAFELTLKKYRKAASLEAIADKGYDQAVTDTDAAMLRDIQAGIRSDFFEFLGKGTATASGKGLQAALANTWGQLKNLYADYGIADSDYVYFVNPLDAAEYLAEANVTIQDTFGMSYLSKFLGLYDVLIHSSVPQGKVYATAKENLICYYLNAANSDVARAFSFVTDETGFVGVANKADTENLTYSTTAVSGVALYARLIDHIVVGTVAAEADKPAATKA